ncbi:MAG: hypothetical protein U1F25_06280 [Rubrivivax sp.]
MSRAARAPLSLRWRLLLATAVAVALATVAAGWTLSALFRDHVQRQFAATLVAQLDQVTARLDLDAEGRPVVDTEALSDPRWSRPYCWGRTGRSTAASVRVRRCGCWWCAWCGSGSGTAALAFAVGCGAGDAARCAGRRPGA